MSNTNDNLPDLPLNQNINVVQLAGAIAVLGTLFGLHLSPQFAAEIAGGLVALMALVTWVLHTFVNHPRQVAQAKTLARLTAIRALNAPGVSSAMEQAIKPPTTFGAPVP